MSFRASGLVFCMAAFLLLGVLPASALEGAWQLKTTIVQMIDTNGTTVSLEPKSHPGCSEATVLVFHSSRALTVHTSTVSEQATYLLVPGGFGDVLLSIRAKHESFMLSLLSISDTQFLFSRLEPLTRYGRTDMTLLENCVGTMTKVSAPDKAEG